MFALESAKALINNENQGNLLFSIRFEDLDHKTSAFGKVKLAKSQIPHSSNFIFDPSLRNCLSTSNSFYQRFEDENNAF